MRQWPGAVILAGFFAVGSLAAGNGPEISILNDKVSITADAISLSRLLRLWDRATGMQSKVPPELANRNLSVRFSGLSLEDAVKKIFQGQPFDYVVVERQGIFVTAVSQALSGGEAVPVYNPQPQAFDQPFVQEGLPNQPFVQPGQPVQMGVPGQPGQQPAVIQTPFGPIANPRANQPVPGNAPVPTQPQFFGAAAQPPAGAANGPAQNNLFGTTPIFQNTSPQQPKQ